MILALSDEGLHFGLNGPVLQKISSFEIKNNILVCHDEKYILFINTDNLKNKEIQIKDLEILGKHEIKEIKKIILSSDGSKVAILTYKKEFFIANHSKILITATNVEKMCFSNNNFVILKKNLQFFTLPNKLFLKVKGTRNFYLQNDIFLFKNSTNILIYRKEKLIKELKFKKLLDMECKISECSNYILLIITIEYVKNSYYGETEFYFVNLEYDLVKKLDCFPVNDFSFLKNGFLVCHGHQPSDVFLYNWNGKLIEKFYKGDRNKIYFNKYENLVCFAGFDKLPGDIEIYDRSKRKIIFKDRMVGASKIVWSESGSFFIVATTNSMKIDNKIVVYDYYGRIIEKNEFYKLFNCCYVPNNEEFEELPEPKVLKIKKENIYQLKVEKK